MESQIDKKSDFKIAPQSPFISQRQSGVSGIESQKTHLSKEQADQNKLLKIPFTDKYEKEMSQMREENYQLNRQFTENLMQMKEQARKL